MNKEKLKKIFIKLFALPLNKIENCSMKNTEKWDSFSHINLIIKIEENFKLKKIDPKYIVKLTNFKECLKYISNKK